MNDDVATIRNKILTIEALLDHLLEDPNTTKSFEFVNKLKRVRANMRSSYSELEGVK